MSVLGVLRTRVRSSIRKALRGNEAVHTREIERAAMKLRFAMPWGHWGNAETASSVLPRCSK